MRCGKGPGPTALAFSGSERRFIERLRLARLATATSSGAPHVVPVCYALVGGNFYFVVDEKRKRTRTGLKRLRNIAENPQVALLIDEYDEDWNRLAFLLLAGRAALVDDIDEFRRALDELRRRYPQYGAMAITFEFNPMVRIEPQQRHFWSATGPRATSIRAERSTK